MLTQAISGFRTTFPGGTWCLQHCMSDLRARAGPVREVTAIITDALSALRSTSGPQVWLSINTSQVPGVKVLGRVFTRRLHYIEEQEGLPRLSRNPPEFKDLLLFRLIYLRLIFFNYFPNGFRIQQGWLGGFNILGGMNKREEK